MTSLLSWVSYTSTGKDRTTPTALYIVSDSRITWGSSARHWDAGRKVFSCRLEAHIFGYCGDVVFPSLVLAQITSAIDSGILFPDGAAAEKKHAIIFESIQRSFERRHNAPGENFSIIHALRIGEDDSGQYFVWQISYNVRTKVWESEGLAIPPKTGVIAILGSGGKSVKEHVRRWSQSDVGARSSAIFSAFCDALFSEEDPHTGGAPQIAALHRGSHGQIIGFVHDGVHYLHGLQIGPAKVLHRLRWRDRHFQAINPTTLKRAAGTRRFERPKGL